MIEQSKTCNFNLLPREQRRYFLPGPLPGLDPEVVNRVASTSSPLIQKKSKNKHVNKEKVY